MTQYCAADGGPLETCWRATYRLLDDTTIEATELLAGRSLCCYEYAFTLEGGTLIIDVVSVDDPAGIGIIAQTGIFETLPFTLVP
jgi:hypothetical protein